MKGDKTVNFTYTVRYLNRECKQVVLEFTTRKDAVARAEYLVNQFDYRVAVCKELMGKCVEMTMYFPK